MSSDEEADPFPHVEAFFSAVPNLPDGSLDAFRDALAADDPNADSLLLFRKVLAPLARYIQKKADVLLTSKETSREITARFLSHLYDEKKAQLAAMKKMNTRSASASTKQDTLKPVSLPPAEFLAESLAVAIFHDAALTAASAPAPSPTPTAASSSAPAPSPTASDEENVRARWTDPVVFATWLRSDRVKQLVVNLWSSPLLTAASADPLFASAMCEWCGCPWSLKRCMQCQSASYCSKACQRKSWKAGHKERCSSVKSAHYGGIALFLGIVALVLLLVLFVVPEIYISIDLKKLFK